MLWILAGHLYAMTPDFLFLFFSIIHRGWMDVFLLHIHFIPGRNLTWYLIFLLSLAAYFDWVEVVILSKRGRVCAGPAF